MDSETAVGRQTFFKVCGNLLLDLGSSSSSLLVILFGLKVIC